MERSDRYGTVSRLFHWGTAALIFANLALGWYAESLGRSRRQLELFLWHKSLGLTILALVLLRLAWRWIARPPPLPASIPLWQRRGAAVSHAMLYSLMIALPLAGWILNSAANVPLRWFGTVMVPALVAPDDGLRELAGAVHEVLAWTLAIVVGIHVLAALKHAFVDRDGIVQRMIGGRRP